MADSAKDAYKRITGRDMPKPWSERTHEDKEQARRHFLASLEASTPEDDAAMDEFVAIIQQGLDESRAQVRLDKDVVAA
jgi:hypothetical protein